MLLTYVVSLSLFFFFYFVLFAICLSSLEHKMRGKSLTFMLTPRAYFRDKTQGKECFYTLGCESLMPGRGVVMLLGISNWVFFPFTSWLLFMARWYELFSIFATRNISLFSIHPHVFLHFNCWEGSSLCSEWWHHLQYNTTNSFVVGGISLLWYGLKIENPREVFFRRRKCYVIRVRSFLLSCGIMFVLMLWKASCHKPTSHFYI